MKSLSSMLSSLQLNQLMGFPLPVPTTDSDRAKQLALQNEQATTPLQFPNGQFFASAKIRREVSGNEQ